MSWQLGSIITTKINESRKPIRDFWKFGFLQCRNAIPLFKHKLKNMKNIERLF
jgi:hypothetical protein